MRKILALVIAAACCFTVFSQNIPEGYLLQYQQNFNGAKALDDFRMENASGWGIFKAGSNFYLQCAAAEAFSLSPGNVAVLNNRIFGDFIFEADVMPLKDSIGVSEICLYLGIRDLNSFYYVHLADFSDSLSNGIFLVKNSITRKLTNEMAKISSWNPDKWQKVRLVRDIIKRTIAIYLDNMTVPHMLIRDYELVMGFVGIGTLKGSARFDNIKIWAPTVLTEKELNEMLPKRKE